MLQELINELRRLNGRHPVRLGNHGENQNCLWHCLHMARTQNLCHAPEYLRQRGDYILSEACAVNSFFHDHYETLRAIILGQFANSPSHRDIIVFNDNLAGAYCVEYYQVYVCIRGR